MSLVESLGGRDGGTALGFHLFRIGRVIHPDAQGVLQGIFPVECDGHLLAVILVFQRADAALPLDAHPVLGNNAVLGAHLGLTDITPHAGLLRLGCLESPVTIHQFKQRLVDLLAREPLHISGGPEQIQRVAWCTGGAQHMIDQAQAWGADLFISGEASEQTFHSAKEGLIHYLGAGHHATETWGVASLADHIKEKFAINCEFVNLVNPI